LLLRATSAPYLLLWRVDSFCSGIDLLERAGVRVKGPCPASPHKRRIFVLDSGLFVLQGVHSASTCLAFYGQRFGDFHQPNLLSARSNRETAPKIMPMEVSSIGISSNHIRVLRVGSPALDANQPKPDNDKARDIDSGGRVHSLRQHKQCREGRPRVRTRNGPEGMRSRQELC
jgi:hypothetical protein